MSTLYERITELCRAKGVSGSRMCLELGMSKSILSDIKSGRKKGVSTDTAQKMAAYLNVSVGYLLGEEEEKKEQPTDHDGLPDKRKAFIDRVMRMSDADLDRLDKILSLVEHTEQ